MLYAALLGGGFLLGLIVGRWWALVAAVGVGVALGVMSELELPAVFVGFVSGVIAAIGVCAGVITRQAFGRSDVLSD